MENFCFPVDLAGCAASRILDGAGEGHIAALFASSFYVKTGGGFVCFGNENLEPGPLNLVTKAPAGTNWRASGLRLNAGVSICAGGISVGSRFSFPLSDAHVWSPGRVDLRGDISGLRNGVRAFRAACAAHVPEEGLGRLLVSGEGASCRQPVCRAAAAPVAALRRWLSAALRQRIKCPVQGFDCMRLLIGLGPGLTPSGDDFIGGVMIALHALDEGRICRQLWEPVRRCATEASNPISCAHLEAASRGCGSAGIHRAVSAITDGCPKQIRASLPGIDRIGHTSGWDAMAGVVLALECRMEARDTGLNSRQDRGHAGCLA